MKKQTTDKIKNTGSPIAEFVKSRRKQLGYTQVAMSQRMGVGLRFLKELEQGKQSVRLDKVNEVLRYFGFTTGPIPIERENPFEDDH